MNIDLLEAFFGKRFSGLVICVIALVVGFFFGKPELFPSLATSLGLMYGVFVSGQSYTDAKEK
jgi:Sec-independent protein translocase protein TatA